MLEFLGVMGIMLIMYLLHFHSYLSSFSTDLFYFKDLTDIRTVSWNTWHFRHRVVQGANPFFTEHILHPQGTSLYMHGTTGFFGVLNLFFNNVALSINVGIAILLISMGVGFYYLSKQWLGHSLSALLVAIIAVFNSYYLDKVGIHLNLMLMACVPFLILLFIQSIDISEGKIKRLNKKPLIAFVVLLFAQILFDHYAIFYTLSFCIVYLAYHLYLNRLQGWSARKKGIVILAILAVGHVASRLLRISGVDEKGAIWAAADIRSLFSPTVNNKWYSSLVIDGLPHTLNDNKMFLGFGLLIILIIAVALFLQKAENRSGNRFFLFALCVYFLVCLPVIKYDGNNLFYSVTGLVHYIPFVNNVRAPDRFTIMLFWLAPLFCFKVFETAGVWRKVNRYIVAGVFLIISFADHQMKSMSAEAQIVKNHELIQETSANAYFVIPFGIRDGYNHYGDYDTYHVMVLQGHKKPMTSGYISRIHKDKWEMVKANSLINHVVQLQEGIQPTESINIREELKELRVSHMLVDSAYVEQHPILKKEVEKWVEEGQIQADSSSYIPGYFQFY